MTDSDGSFEIVQRFSRLFPQVPNLDFLRYRTDTPWHPAVESFASLSSLNLLGAAHDYNKLRNLSINCNSMQLANVWPVFTLPNLDKLHLHNTYISLITKQDVYHRWQGLVPFRLQAFRLSGFRMKQWSLADVNPLMPMFRACRQLHTFSIQSDEPGNTRTLLDTVPHHFSSLKCLELYSEPSPTGSIVAIDAASGPIPTFSMPDFRASESLQSLVIDAAELLEIV